MTVRSDDFRRQVNDLWKQAVDQLEEVKELIVKSTGRFDLDLRRLRRERDHLLNKLGEQTFRLANQGKLPMPSIVRRTVDRLNEVIEGIVVTEDTARSAEVTEGSVQKKGNDTTGKGSKTPASVSPAPDLPADDAVVADAGQKTATKKKTSKKAAARKTTKKKAAKKKTTKKSTTRAASPRRKTASKTKRSKAGSSE